MRLIDSEALIQDAETDLTWGMLSKINRAETVDAEPVRHGKWNITEIDGTGYIVCSECGDKIWNREDVTELNIGMNKYCRNCGAKMECAE